MPELPEVETTRLGITPWVLQKKIIDVKIRESRLRWPIPQNIKDKLLNREIFSVKRRAKYLLLETNNGSAIIHLGMSGSLRIIKNSEPAGKHDHFDIVFSDGLALRFRDPRRFGSFLWSKNPLSHSLLNKLGPEPLESMFTGTYLWEKARKRKVTIKQFIMNAQIVVGVGNIYASESLYMAGINPRRQAGRISKIRMEELVISIKKILKQAINAGGTTLRDFHTSDGGDGYFKTKLSVYDRKCRPCLSCAAPISMVVIGQRSTFYCKNCQT
ncbi:MAG: bifunctional DNA-formamidopyrimidine glycosylase/DNA-(apurinic or apyrimidinic site) lyase [Woeseiaceae bacterium]|jgi:formamidopyrimidine-DNA glycosylase|nr:bifunctional DNA-formamidopyrimidine glycosylase/DNA-(apurinic or apyrimidinic site) lyase [Woeseiaceae bacterium]|tara:strand:+ start:417 stop:1229 length:813 start_codon:yes stop_codon:yes gene_type:complete